MRIATWCVVLFTAVSTAQQCWRDTLCNGPKDAAFPGPWEKNIYAPASRTVKPQSILSTRDHRVSYVEGSGKNVLKGNGSQIIFDFGLEVGGILSVSYKSSGTANLNMAFTESKTWVGEYSDSSNGKFKQGDGYLVHNITASGSGTYVMPDEKLRGGFRYLTLFLTTADQTTSVDITGISLEIGFQPTWQNLRAYQGYFHSDDEMLNRIWYSGAYTIQTNSVPVATGRQVPMLSYGWANNGTLGPGDTIIVDGAKRDRAVWPGDMGVAVAAGFVSVGELDSVKNALQVMYDHQASTGAFDESGPPLSQKGSDTYHMWSMIGTYNYVLFSNDTAFLQKNWAKYQKAMDYVYGKVDPASGLLMVTGTRDWARWQQGFNNSEAQMILYHTLKTGSELAGFVGDHTGLADTWTTRANNLKKAVNALCFDEGYGAFKDNATATTLHPQDANSMSILFDVADEGRVSTISSLLTKNWTPIGAETPELPNNISPFISSFEIQAHFVAGRADRALDLIRRTWGWYLNNPNGTESTVIEGYLVDGTFGYRSDRGYSHDASYVSHSHGWSAGPTSALTNYVLGLSVTGPVGSTWQLAPQFGDLKSVEGGFTTSLGKFQASWKRQSEKAYSLSFSAPEGTTGVVFLPTVPGKGSVKLDGKPAAMKSQGGKRTISVTGGGSHRVEVIG